MKGVFLLPTVELPWREAGRFLDLDSQVNPCGYDLDLRSCGKMRNQTLTTVELELL